VSHADVLGRSFAVSPILYVELDVGTLGGTELKPLAEFASGARLTAFVFESKSIICFRLSVNKLCFVDGGKRQAFVSSEKIYRAFMAVSSCQCRNNIYYLSDTSSFL
jgi:hypothetical protein